MKKLLLSITVCLGTFFGMAQNNSLTFDGTDDHISLDNAFAFENTDVFTVEAYIKLDTPNGLQQIISKLDLSFRGWGFQIMDTGVLSGYLFSTFLANQRYVEGTTNLVDGQWHHVAMVFDGENITLYVDGMLEDLSFDESLGGTLGTIDNVGKTHIGNYDAEGFNGEHLIGNIDELRIWNSVRSEADINSTLATELSGTEANLIGYYKMDETDSGCDIVDCGPSGLHGTRMGATGANNLPQFSGDVPTLTDVECGDGLGCELSVSEFQTFRVNAFPNPTKDVLNIRGEDIQIAKARVMDLTGKLVKELLVQNNQMNLGELPGGLYIIKLEDALGQSSLIKILKQ